MLTFYSPLTANEAKTKREHNLVQMQLRTLMAWPLFDIHVIAAFVNPFTSDATVARIGTYSQQYPYLKASSASQPLVR
ncbi:hypothetical protein BEL05_01410 [Shewanella colwelliana]|uniref:Uncharacterized protein n=1 Tax=Shewanella colwelliana TaxID=23 RepID=A0A1E5IUR2_SHECO|nr:hypothetical protein BEL05_01325 [Shewanella colwelliana]OEG74280.1 hypothetical protein BEL05_01410 [Shewanella colwelliana]